MPTERRSPWFNARTDPPVNGGDDAVYEQRCTRAKPPHLQMKEKEMTSVYWLVRFSCHGCEWRGLLRESDDGK